jgi:hypothetical protein
MAMNGRAISMALATCTFLAMVFAVTVGAAGRGETSEAWAKAVCLDAVWPTIPAECLIGSTDRDVRLVATGAKAAGVRQAAELSADVFFPHRIKHLRQDFHFKQMQVMNLTEVEHYDGVSSGEDAT